jgi:hypothetical protein
MALYHVRQRPKNYLNTLHCIVEAPSAAAAVRLVLENDKDDPQGMTPDGDKYREFSKPTAAPLVLNKTWWS